jgi:restriction endonuclease Mrr
MVMGAGESIALNARHADGREFGLSIEDIAYSVDTRLRLRCLLPLPGLYQNRDGSLSRNRRVGTSLEDLKQSLLALEGSGWEVRLIPDAPLTSSLVVDEDAVIYYQYLNDTPGPFYSSERSQVRQYREGFENAWAQSYAVSGAQALYDRAEVFGLPEASGRLAVVSHEAWEELIQELSRFPERLHDLDPRKFEELIAELLAREGLDVQITPSTRDGGRDILAFHETAIGRHLYLVECKRHRPERPVGVSVVRQLYGVVAQERATAGLVVATARFSREALTFVEAVKHQMGLKDYDAVTNWIRAHVSA